MEELLHEDEIPVGRAKDLRGQVFGRLTVLYRVAAEGKKARWKCRCECGNTITPLTSDLTTGHTKSCGCLKNQYTDLTGQKFGDLVVVKRDKNIGNKIAWLCKCECGNLVVVRGDSLASRKNCGCKSIRSDFIEVEIGEKFSRLTVISDPYKDGPGRIKCDCLCECGNKITTSVQFLRLGYTRSCGCLQKERVKELGGWNASDLTGQRFGRLIAKYPTEERKNNCVVWHCECDCGGHKEVASTNLITGATKSCGCLGSKGEEKIFSLLKENNIDFETQKSFDDCKFKKVARFDFYIKDFYLVEYDGIQHFKIHGWNTEEKLADTIRRDQYKNQWCKENNIPLIRIPYTKLDTLCIEDLMLETTQFRVV